MNLVAPHAGAWIETCRNAVTSSMVRPVAPHAGAWIETGSAGAGAGSSTGSHPTRVRGLKH